MRAPAEQVIVDVDSNFQWPFEVKTIIVDNLTDHYAYSPDAQRFIQPNIAGLVLPIHPTQTPKLLWKAPPGKTQPTLANNAQELTIVFVDSLFPPTSGSTVVAAVTSTWPDGTAALPGFANQNDLSMGLYRKAANQLGFSVAGVERFELGVDYAAIRDGTDANPGLSFLSDLTTGIDRPAANTIGFPVAGVRRVTFGTVNASFALHVVPVADATQDLGSGAQRFRDEYLSSTLQIGSNPATAYTIRQPNNTYHAWRNVANTGNIAFGVDSANAWYWDNGAATVLSITQATGTVNVFNALAVGTTPATTGILRLPTSVFVYARNVGNTANEILIGRNAADNVTVGGAAAYPDFGQALIGLGGGAAPTFGTIGGTGPAGAAQVGWQQIYINGTKSFVPIWR